MTTRKWKTVDPEEIPEVMEFMAAQQAIEEFKDAHRNVFEVLETLVERYNTTLEQADKACRGQRITSGPFDLYQVTTKYNAEALYNAIGREEFLKLGGSVGTKATYDVDKGKLEAAIAQNKIDPNIVQSIRIETPNYHKPHPLSIP